METTGYTHKLEEAVARWPTPIGRDYKDGDAHSCRNVPVNGFLGRAVHMLPTLWEEERGLPRREVDGALSPDWVSWLMGLPVGWTSLEPLPREDYDHWLQAQFEGAWWLEEQGLPRVATGVKNRVNRLKCLGNGIVPLVVANFLEEGYPCGQPMKRNREQSYPTIRTY
jgi:hypothetical protein